MKEDGHYDLTLAVALSVGLDAKTAQLLAWSDYYTDKLTKPALHGMQTQCELGPEALDKTEQMFVLVPFHFLPGDDPEQPWLTTPNCRAARALINRAIEASDPIMLGTALHSLQDTFTHEQFTGWDEGLNDSGSMWGFLIPKIGHACFGTTPDTLHATWTDHRTDTIIHNNRRALAAAHATFNILVKYYGQSKTAWPVVKKLLRPAFKSNEKDRVKALRILGGRDAISFESADRIFRQEHEGHFIEAARQHLSLALKYYP